MRELMHVVLRRDPDLPESVMMDFVFVMSFPRAYSCADADGVNICPHGVLDVRGHIQEASNRIRPCSRLIELGSDRNLEGARDYRNPCVLVVKVVLPMASG